MDLVYSFFYANFGFTIFSKSDTIKQNKKGITKNLS